MNLDSPRDQPHVLHVDDNPEDLKSWADEIRQQDQVTLAVCHPSEVDARSIKQASLVLVDFKIDAWPSREQVAELALKPANGLALLSVFQEVLDEPSPPRAFALFTAVIEEVARGVAPHPNIIARANNLEWVFDKRADGGLTRRAQRVAELALAVRALPSPWPTDAASVERSLKSWLGLSHSADWSAYAWEEILNCRPPIHQFAESTQGLSVVRWALHRILPYPTFLLDDMHVAARLRVDPSSLEEKTLQALLAPAEYRGSLASFGGRRWWRAGVESIAFGLASADPANIAVLHRELKARTAGLSFISDQLPVVTLDENLRARNVLAPQEGATEIMPDDWPPFADQAWALKSDIEAHPSLAAIAVH